MKSKLFIWIIPIWMYGFSKNDCRKLRHGILLGIAYAANIGGTGSLIGTAPNIVMFGIVEEQVSAN